VSEPWLDEWACATERQTGGSAELHCGEGQHLVAPFLCDKSAALAAAAPDLYRALEAFMRADETGHLVWGTSPEYRIQTAELAKSALRKARGE
jgi:hypothetical protein